MALLHRAVVIIFAYLAAAIIAVAVIAVAIYWLTLTNPPMIGTPHPALSKAVAMVLRLAGAVAVPVVASAFVPAMLLAVLFEIFRLRSVLLYAISGGVVAAISIIALRLVLFLFMFRPQPPARGFVLSFSIPWFIVMAGVVSGLVYWALAGRYAGQWRDAAAKA
jgi:hypothetical protein